MTASASADVMGIRLQRSLSTARSGKSRTTVAARHPVPEVHGCVLRFCAGCETCLTKQ